MRERDNSGKFKSDKEPNNVNLTIRISKSLEERLEAAGRKSPAILREVIISDLERFEKTLAEST